jgi:tape measure domain-containing protein
MSVRLSLLVGDFITNARKAGQSVSGIADAAAKPVTAMQGLRAVSSDLGKTLTASAGLSAAAMGSWAASAFATGAAYNTLQQTAGSALETLMGSAQAATAQMAELTEFTKTSPFPRQLWIQAQQTLIGFGVAADDIVPTLAALQDGVVAVGGSAQSIEEVVLILAKISSVGKVTAEDLNELGVRGIDAAGLIGEAFGESSAEIRDSISSGSLDAATFLDTLVTQLQSRFGGAAEGLRETWVGAYDRIKGATRDVGSILAAPFIDPAGGGAAVTWANDVADAIRAFEDALGPAVEFLERQADPAFQAVSETVRGLTASINDVDLVEMISNISEGGSVLVGFGAAAAAAGSASVLSAVGMGQLAGVVNPLTAGLVAASLASPEFRDALFELVQAAAPLVPVLTEVLIQVAAIGSSGVGAAGDLVSSLVPAVSLLLNIIMPAAEFVGVLASMISEIPSPVLTATAAIFGISMAVKALAMQVKTFGVLSLAASFVGLADAAGKAKFAIGGLVGTAVLIGIQALMDGIDDTVEKLELINSIGVQGLANDLQLLGDTGRITAGLEQMFGSGSDAADNFNRSLLIATASWYDWDNGLNVTIAENEAAEQSFKSLDSAMAQLVAGGQDADDVLNTLVETYDLQGEEVDQLLALLPQYRAEADRQKNGSQDAAFAAQQHADAQAELAEQTEHARLSLKELADEIRAQTDPVFAAIRATRDLEEAEKAYQDAIDEHGASSDEARDAMLDLLDAQSEAATAAGEMAEVASSMPEELIAMAEAAGISAEGIEWLRQQFENAQTSGEDFSSAVADINADITTSTGRMQVENALIYAGMSESQAQAIVQMKAMVDELIASGYSYSEAMAIVADQSNVPMGAIEESFKDMRDAGLEFSDEYPAEVRLEGDEKVIRQAERVQAWMDSIQRTVTISFKYTSSGDWHDFLPRGGASIPYSTGGRVGGPLGAGDVIPASLTPGEHVWTRAEVDAAGGHEALEAMRAAVLAGKTRFAVGGSSSAVSHPQVRSSAGVHIENFNLEAVNERLDMRQVRNELMYDGAV